jgi:hypothetical protein
VGLFCVVWTAIGLGFLGAAVSNMADIVELRSSGIRATGTALRTWTETHTSTDSEGGTSTTTDHYTRVRYVDRNGGTHEKTVSGAHRPPSAVALVYHPDNPGSARPVGEVSGLSLGAAVTWVVISAGFVLVGFVPLGAVIFARR